MSRRWCKYSVYEVIAVANGLYHSAPLCCNIACVCVCDLVMLICVYAANSKYREGWPAGGGWQCATPRHLLATNPPHPPIVSIIFTGCFKFFFLQYRDRYDFFCIQFLIQDVNFYPVTSRELSGKLCHIGSLACRDTLWNRGALISGAKWPSRLNFTIRWRVICGPSVSDFLRVTHLVPRILKCLCIFCGIQEVELRAKKKFLNICQMHTYCVLKPQRQLICADTIKWTRCVITHPASWLKR